MKPIPTPPRLSSTEGDAPDSLRAALRAAASDKPSEQNIQALRGVLAPIFAAPPAASLGPAAASTAAKVVFGKAAWWLAVGAVGAGTFGAWRWMRAADDAPAPVRVSPPAQTAPAAASASVESAPMNRREEVAPAPAPAPARDSPRARPSEPAAFPPAPASDTKAKETAPAVSELTLLEQARHAATADPGRSLGLVAEMRRQFPQGAFSEERDFLEVEALKRLGRTSEARALEDRFHARYPNSMHGRTLQVQPR